jgi:Uncharacterized protein conserved in bacteria
VSGEEISVERDSLRREAKRFGDGAAKVRQIFKTLESALSAEGKCWGGDETGKGFESTYTKPQQTAESSFQELPKKLDEAQSAVESMASNYGAAETSSGGDR